MRFASPAQNSPPPLPGHVCQPINIEEREWALPAITGIV